MFYNKKLEIYDTKKGHLTSSGVWVEEEQNILLESIPCDIQPYTNDLAYKQYGYDGNVSYKIFCNNNRNLKLNNIIGFNDNLFRIVVCKKWDDYTILVVVDKNDS